MIVKELTLSLNRNEKAAVVTDVAAQVARSQTLALAEYRGLTVDHLNVLRKQARERGVYLHVPWLVRRSKWPRQAWSAR